ncbi:BMC domain-containing protein [Bacillus sp. JJ1533]|uniref:BMC domain-containing protein n=1 Tax=Bacillus sp. JJ1533 TaxID=3122959 RepID=UPI003F689C91
MTKALGMIETRGLATSIEVADAMLKNANVRLVNQSMVDAALVTILVEGDVSAVQAAVESGTKIAERTGALISSNVIPHPDNSIRPLVAKIDKEIGKDKDPSITDKPNILE